MTRRAHKQESGFALIVVGALFIAFAFVAAAAIDRTNATKQIDMATRTRAQMSRLSDALLRYSLANNNRYPCPASMAVAANAATFGQPVTGCHTGSPAGLTALTTATLRGAVPVTELLTYGADPNDMFDSWGNRIMYIVDKQLTLGGTGTASADGDRPSVADPYTSTVFRSPDYVLLSYGRDGVGATPRAMTSVAIACPVISDLRATNCDTDAAFVTRPIGTGPGLDASQYFDDILVFYGR